MRERLKIELRRVNEELEARVKERTAEIQRQASLLEQSHDAIMAWEIGGRIVYWNRGAQELYGWSVEEAMGQTTHALLATRLPMSLEAFELALLKEG